MSHEYCHKMVYPTFKRLNLTINFLCIVTQLYFYQRINVGELILRFVLAYACLLYTSVKVYYINA